MGVRAKQSIAIVAGLVLAAIMVLLGLWQQASYEESTHDFSAERAALPAVPLAENVLDDGTIGDVYGRPVTLSGEYEDGQALVGSEQPLRVVNPFRMDDGRVIAVVRGSTDGGDVAPPPTGKQDLTAIFLAPDLPADETAEGADLGSVRVQVLAQNWPGPMIGGYLTLSEADSRAQGLQPAEALLPEAEGSATHRGYALQWWVFAAGAIAFGFYAARGIGKDEEKRRAKLAKRRPTKA